MPQIPWFLLNFLIRLKIPWFVMVCHPVPYDFRFGAADPLPDLEVLRVRDACVPRGSGGGCLPRPSPGGDMEVMALVEQSY